MLLAAALPITARTAAAADFAPGEVLVKVAEDAYPLAQTGVRLVSPSASLTAALARQGAVSAEQLFPEYAYREDTYGLLRWYRVLLEGPADVLRAVQQLSQTAGVEVAEPNYAIQACVVPNDPGYSDQWAHETINSEMAWDIQQGSPDVVIAVIDSGLDMDHEDLVSVLWQNTDETAGNGIDDDGNGFIDDRWGWDFSNSDNDVEDDCTGDVFGHGTHVAGIAAAATNNGVGVASVSWGCRVMVVKLFPNAYVDRSARAITYAADNGAKIVNCSYGAGGASNLERDAVNHAFDLGVFIAAAIGNDGQERMIYPAGHEHVTSVGWTGKTDVLNESSNYHTDLDVCAPGSGIRSTWPPNTYYRAQGTSMASPHVAGLAGLIMSQNPGLMPSMVELRIKLGADNIDEMNPTKIGKLGAGRINSYQSLVGHSLIDLIEIVVNDQGGDADGQMDSGETVNLDVILMNRAWKTAQNVSATITTTAEFLTITTATQAYPNLAAKVQTTNATPFVIEVDDDAPFNTPFSMHLTVTADDNTVDFDIDFLVNDPRRALPGWPINLGASNQIMGSPALADLIPGDGPDKNIVLIDGNYTVHCFRTDGTELPGWPVVTDPTDSSFSLSTPGIGDVDNDGALEIVTAGYNAVTEPYPASIYVFERDGSVAAGWPVVTSGSIKGSPALADLDGNSDMEIIVGDYANKMYVFNHDGSAFPGWPVDVDGDVFSSAAIADLDGDGEMDIFVATKDDSADPQWGKAYLFETDGTIKTGWPLDIPDTVYPSAIFTDIDEDGELEILFACGDYSAADTVNNHLFALNSDGSDVPGWPVQVSNSVYSSLGVGDIDGDQHLEVAAATLDDKIFAVNHDGTVMPGFPYTAPDQFFSNVTIADVSGDGLPDIVAGNYDGNLHAVTYMGESVEGWPLYVGGQMFSSTTFDVMNAAGDIAFFTGSQSGTLYGWWMDDIITGDGLGWKKHRYDLCNSGVFPWEPSETTPTPTPTAPPSPTATPTPSPTPALGDTGTEIWLNKTTFHAGDTFLLSARVTNADTQTYTVDEYILLDVYNQYWFWPGWTQDIGFETKTLTPYSSLDQEILQFTWPTGAGAANGIKFWIAMFQQGTFDIVGLPGGCEFGFE